MVWRGGVRSVRRLRYSIFLPCQIVVAEVGFEPHDLEGMNLASYRAALLRDVFKHRKIADSLQR